MRVFVTGATGFIGSAIVRELLSSGHQVLGMARSDAAAETLRGAGVEVHRGDLSDPASLVAGAEACDGVAHTAFIHDFSRFMENAAIEQRAVTAVLQALEGSGKPFVASSGVALLAPGRMATEADGTSAGGLAEGRAETERRVIAASEQGVRSAVVRLAPTVHGAGDHGFVPRLVEIARQTGVAAYVGDGANRWPAVHRLDAARLYRLALEAAPAGTRLHAVGEEGVPMRAIAETIGQGLGVPVRSLSPDEAAGHFGWIGAFAGLDCPASSARTRALLDWTPQGPDLLTDMRENGYFG